jgi:Bacterial aa3 type cytochrome c oxidase subunit IV
MPKVSHCDNQGRLRAAMASDRHGTKQALGIIMADHGHTSSQPAVHGLAAHTATYNGFINFSAAGTIICLYIMVALVTFRFMDNPWNVLVGFGGMVVGIITTLIGLRMGGKWMLPVVVLVLYGLFVANNIHMS